MVRDRRFETVLGDPVARASETLVSARRPWQAALAAAAVAIGLFVLPVPAEAADTSIFMVGNSLSRGVKGRLRKLLGYDGIRAHVYSVTTAGTTLEDHLESRRVAKRFAKRDRWDWVVLQEQSAGIWDERLESSEGWAARAETAGAVPLLMMTWADRGMPTSIDDWLLGDAYGDHGYLAAATLYDTELAAAGLVFRELAADPYMQSRLWSRDGHHAASLGRWAAALSLYREIRGAPIDLAVLAEALPGYPSEEVFAAVETARQRVADAR